MAEETVLEAEVLENTIGRIAYTLDKDYLNHLHDEYVVCSFENYIKQLGLYDDDVNFSDETSFKNYYAIKITKFVINKDEKVIDCMKNILATFSNSADTIALVIKRKVQAIEFYFVFKNNSSIDVNKVKTQTKLFLESFKGNFPGSSAVLINSLIYEPDIKDSKNNLYTSFSFIKKTKALSMFTSIPSEKSQDYLSQGIEKLLNGIVPETENKEYAIMILAESIQQEKIREIINGFEEMATSIIPFASHQFQTGKNESESNGEMKSATNTKGISHAISKTHSVNIGLNAGRTSGTSTTHSEFKSKTTNAGAAVAVGADLIGSIFPVVGGAISALGAIAGPLIGSTTKGTSVAKTVSNFLSLGISGGYGYSWGKIDTTSKSKSLTDGTNHNITIGTSENTTYNYRSYQVSNLIEKLEATIKRLNESKSTGLWKSATYIMSEDASVTKNVANFLRGISQGDESYIESATVQQWYKDESKKENPSDTEQAELNNQNLEEIKKYIFNFMHPIFINKTDLGYNLAITNNKDAIKAEIRKSSLEPENILEAENAIDNAELLDIIPVTPTTNVSTTELAKLFALPSNSVPGLPVLECAQFGRNICTFETNTETNYEQIKIGKIFHMHAEENLPVILQKQSLASHTFITGSTGSGKSNTIYKILNECKKKQCSFLVIEPAKGEYKTVFGNDSSVTIYSTNKNISKLLTLNPFSFPKEIHILEHLDRLVEIFNVCWPMYAAMPAVLKEAVEKSYEDTGWDLTESTNEYGENLYPTFSDVTRNIRTIIDSSEYDAENKGAYKGSLITRLKSLTNGINGQIFSSDEIPPEKLFDENVIIDISRVGSIETKSLLMGIIILKLQEYRMTTSKINENLKHITVLEEAHNLLKRTSTEQFTETANLVGRSVQMLSNAIAEMRTYGEGFIVADQSPGLLDLAVIRNTNTKIIMRLPDLSDRELVGRAANLNSNQIDELAKLPRGVAAVYQNEWVEPVLCKVEKVSVEETEYKYTAPPPISKPDTTTERIRIAKLLFAGNAVGLEVYKKDLDNLKQYEKLSASTEVAIRKNLTTPAREPRYTKLSPIIKDLFPKVYEVFKDIYTQTSNATEWTNAIDAALYNLHAQLEIETVRDIRQCVITQYLINEISNNEAYQAWRRNAVR